MLLVFERGSHFPFAFSASTAVVIKIIVVIENGFYQTFTWNSVLLTSFLVNVIAAVLKREFHKCIENLREKINETGTLSNDIFSEIMERFTALRNMVQKVDDMFSPIICLNLTLSLGILCGAIYASNTEGQGNIEQWHIPIIVSVETLVVTLIQATELHNPVSRHCGWTSLILITTV